MQSNSQDGKDGVGKHHTTLQNGNDEDDNTTTRYLTDNVKNTPSHSRMRLTNTVSPIGRKSGLLVPRVKTERSLSASSSIITNLKNTDDDNHLVGDDNGKEGLNTKSTVALSKDVQGVGNLTPSQELEMDIALNSKDGKGDTFKSPPIMTVYSGNSSPSTERSRSPVKSRTGKERQSNRIAESDNEDQAELQGNISSLQKQKDGVNFLTKRLRSAIGQEILIQEDEQADQVKSSVHSSDVQRPEKSTNSSIPGKNDGAGWGWSTLTNLPSTLRIDQALQSLSLQQIGNGGEASSSTSSKVKQTSDDQGNAANTSTGGALMAGWSNAVDPRNWFNSGEKGEDKSKQNVTNQSSPSKSSQSKNIPTGSFPSSGSTASRKAKERERAKIKAQEIEQAAIAAAEKERKQAGSKVEEHDFQEHHFGILDKDLTRYRGERFPEHEYMIMSTAGKPIFWSKISKARLMRARQNRYCKRERQAELERRKVSGEDVAKEAEEFHLREETLSKEEQSIQDEEDQLEATRVGVLQAIISNYAETDKNKLHETSSEVLELPETGKTAFLLRPPLYLIAISHWDEAETTLRNHLEYLYQAIISLVSAVKLKLLFDRAANFDLKRLLQGTDNILDSLLTGLQSETIAMRGALQPLRLNAAVRHDVGTCLIPTRNKDLRPQDALYALLLTRNGIITLARRKKHSIHPIDCHLLVNTVLSTNALKEGGTQSWVPVCLPKFAPQGFMYAHVSFLDDESIKEKSDRQPNLGLVLVTGNPDGFEDMSGWRERIVTQLKENEMLTNLLQTSKSGAKGKDEDDIDVTDNDQSQSTQSIRYSADQLGIPGLRHFCFKWRSNVQSTSPMFEDPYLPGTDDHHRLLYLYGMAHEYVVKSAKENGKKSKEIHQDNSSNASPALSDAESNFKSRKGKGREEGEGVETDDASSIHTNSTVDRKSRSDKKVEQTSRINVRSSSPPIIPRSVLQANRQNSSSNSTTTSAAGLLKQTIGMGNYSKTTFTHLLRTRQESILAWSTPPFELYLCASPHIPKTALIAMAKSIVKWIKQEEHQLFIVSAPIF